MVISIGPHGDINPDRGLFSRTSGEISRSMLHLAMSSHRLPYQYACIHRLAQRTSLTPLELPAN